MGKFVVKFITIGMVSLLLISSSISISSKNISLSKSNSYDIYVDDDADPTWYDKTHVRTIQEGVNNASSGHSIFVYGGTYIENILVNKAVDLIGERSSITIVDGGFIDNVFYVAAESVSISNFTIRNSAHIWGQIHAGIFVISDNTNIFKNRIMNNWNGIFLDETSNDNRIVKNDISLNSDYGSGIWALGSNDNVIKNNTIFNNRYGITLESYAENNVVINNSIKDNLIGIKLLFHANNNSIKKNILNDNYWGIKISFYCSNNNISYNKLTGNNDSIFLHDCSSENIIFKNTINKGYYGIHLLTNYFSEKNVLIKNVISDNYYGLEIRFSHNTLITDNNIINNHYGIYNYGSWFTVVTKNIIISNNNGISLMHANNNTVFENNILNNENIGIYLNASFDNMFYHNNMIENVENAYDDGANFWYNSSLYEGNFWSDFKKNPGYPEYYVIPGGENVDVYPLLVQWPPLLGDINGDGIVNVDDLLLVLAAWGPNPGHPADINGDGVVNVEDLLIVLANWS